MLHKSNVAAFPENIDTNDTYFIFPKTIFGPQFCRGQCVSHAQTYRIR